MEQNADEDDRIFRQMGDDIIQVSQFDLITKPKRMRLLFTPLNEIFFKKADDDRMQGTIEMNNPASDTIFAFKIKCTNPDLFQVNPLKGLIKAGQKLHIEFRTNDPVSLDYARQLVSKHKFLIEFVPVTSELSIPNFKSQQSDRKKYYINMDSVRGSRLFKDNERMSMQSGVSNKMSYLSMKGEQQKLVRERDYLTPRKYQNQNMRVQSSSKSVLNDDLNQKYSKLKEQLEDLHLQRQQIINQMSSTRRPSNAHLKKLIVFLIFLVIGVILGNQIESYIQIKKIQVELEQKKKQETKPWRLFGFLDYLYDEVDPQDL